MQALRQEQQVSDARTQVTEFWNGLDSSRRKVLGAATAASVIVLCSVGWWASQPSYTALTRISDGDTRTAVVDNLSVAGVHWRLGADGQTIEVLSSEEQAARKAGAGQHGLVGLSGVDQLDPWITPFQEQLQKQKMLQEELVMQINGIDGVAASRVLLNLKAGTGFIGDDARASASVTVKADTGVNLTRDLGKAIAQLVSHSVAGMTEAEVTVLDQGTGRAIWSGDHTADTTSSNDDSTKRSEALAASVTASLAAVLGSPEHVRVTVHVDLDTTSSQSTTSEVDPDSQAPLRERSETDQNATPVAATNGGEAGVSSNQPQSAISTVASSGTSRKREETDSQYQYTTTQVTTHKPAGAIKRLSAAVFIDNATIVTLAANAKMDETALRAELEKSAKTALGMDDKRGDSVTVSFVPFAETQMSDAGTVSSFPWERLAPSAVALVAVLLTFFMLIRPLLNKVSGKGGATGATGAGELDEEGASAPMTEAGAARGAAAYASHAAGTESGEEGKVIDLASRLRRQVEGFKHVSAEDVSELVLRETDHSTEVLRRWIRS